MFNIGSQEELSIIDLATRIIDMTGSDSPIHLIAYADAYEAGFEDMPRRYPDIGKISSMLGWSPMRTLDEILSDVIDFYQGEGPPP